MQQQPHRDEGLLKKKTKRRCFHSTRLVVYKRFNWGFFFFFFFFFIWPGVRSAVSLFFFFFFFSHARSFCFSFLLHIYDAIRPSTYWRNILSAFITHDVCCRRRRRCSCREREKETAAAGGEGRCCDLHLFGVAQTSALQPAATTASFYASRAAYSWLRSCLHLSPFFSPPSSTQQCNAMQCNAWLCVATLSVGTARERQNKRVVTTAAAAATITSYSSSSSSTSLLRYKKGERVV